jgi:DNA-directed RNA polymerase specialized sigma24 family protein
MACAGRILVWWDRDLDSGGRPIRSDVRSAARELWQQACHRAVAELADDGAAAELMEKAVAQASRYLDRMDAPLSSRKHGLVMIAFCRALRRYRARSSRLELLGASTDFGNLAIANSWAAQANARLDLEKLIRRLSTSSNKVLMLRAAGYEWKEIGQMFETTAGAIRNRFWREIDKIRRDD